MSLETARVQRAWCLYDWANSAFATTVMAAVLPTYFVRVAASDLPAARATAAWGYLTSALLVLSALLAPIVGAVADHYRSARAVLAACVAAGSLATVCLAGFGRGEWAGLLVAYGLASLAFAFASVVYDGMLLAIAGPSERDRLSARGFAWGYAGGGLLLLVHAAWITRPQTFGFADAAGASRAALLTVGIWWALFSLPLIRRAPVLPRDPSEVFRHPLARIRQTLAHAGEHREAWKFLLAFWLYNDAVGTVVKMAAVYGASLGFGQAQLVGALLLVQILAVPATLAAGALGRRFGAKACILAGIGAYGGVALLGFFMSRPVHFWILAGLVALAQGGVQALSRSYFAGLVPARRGGEMFGYYSLSSRMGGFLGTFLFATAAQLTGASRWGSLTLLPLLAGGALLLLRVRPRAHADASS